MRRPRQDAPDTWHHVMNRGLARRTILETDDDRRMFLALLAREVHGGRIEVHAFSLMLTHFHLLVRSVTGELSEAMRRITCDYARYFNRTRRRDGPLFRGRFLSRRIGDLVYRRRVVTYIHDNAVKVGLVKRPAEDVWCSASHYAGTERPKWLSTDWVDGEVAARGKGCAGAEALEAAFPSAVEDEFRFWVESQLSARLPAEIDELEDVTLKHAGSPKVVRWAMERARLADGTQPFRPPSPAARVQRIVNSACARLGPLKGYFRRKGKDAWRIMQAGLLRLLAGCKHHEIGCRTNRHASTVSRDIRDHQALFKVHPAYAKLTSELAHAVLQAR